MPADRTSHVPLLDRLRQTLTWANAGAHIITPDDLPAPRAGGEWDAEMLGVFSLARAQAAKVGAHPICHNTGDGWVFGWGSDDPRDDYTESLEPLLPIDWWPGPDALWSSELEALGFVEV